VGNLRQKVDRSVKVCPTVLQPTRPTNRTYGPPPSGELQACREDDPGLTRQSYGRCGWVVGFRGIPWGADSEGLAAGRNFVADRAFLKVLEPFGTGWAGQSERSPRV